MPRCDNWSHDETSLLIALWSEADIQKELDGTHKNKKVFDKIAVELKENGYEERNGEQCRIRMKNLRSSYQKVVDNNKKSGSRRKTCPFFTELNAVLGSRPLTAPANVVESASISPLDDSGISEDGHRNSTSDEEEPNEPDAQEACCSDYTKRKSKASITVKTKRSKTSDMISEFMEAQWESRKMFMEIEKERIKMEKELELSRQRLEMEQQKKFFDMMCNLMQFARPSHSSNFSGNYHSNSQGLSSFDTSNSQGSIHWICSMTKPTDQHIKNFRLLRTV